MYLRDFLQRIPPENPEESPERPCRGFTLMLRGWSCGCLFEGYVHGGPGFFLRDGQSEVYLEDTGMTVMASARASV